jgi:AcrR family transcriptional regulator
LPRATKDTLQPRKQPAQQRSSETVEAILQATIQVLVAVGKERLTTTRVAHRAGVSVGTLYQYFPNKSALLQATLRRHIEGVQTAVEQVCHQKRSRPLPDMTTALVDAYLGAKMRNVKESAVLYSVSSDVDGMAIAQAAGQRVRHALAEMFATAPEGLTKEPELVASVVSAALNGISRRLLESKFPERHLPVLREELLTLLHVYLRTCARTSLSS